MSFLGRQKTFPNDYPFLAFIVVPPGMAAKQEHTQIRVCLQEYGAKH